MIAPTLLFFASLLGIAFALQNPDWSDVLLLSIPCALASAVLLLREIVRRVVALRQRAKRWVIVDGSNVMYWRDNTPRLETVREVVSHLRDLRFDVSVVFDANAGYLQDKSLSSTREPPPIRSSLKPPARSAPGS